MKTFITLMTFMVLAFPGLSFAGGIGQVLPGSAKPVSKTAPAVEFPVSMKKEVKEAVKVTPAPTQVVQPAHVTTPTRTRGTTIAGSTRLRSDALLNRDASSLEVLQQKTEAANKKLQRYNMIQRYQRNK